ncbi:MAG: hypothetical protein ACPLX7_10350 [Candidatus Kapaibacteriota bacterium]
MRIDFGEGWFYDYEEMTVAEQLRAKTYWQLYLRGLEVFPVTPREEEIFLQEMNELKAVASLMKKGTEYTIDEAVEFLKREKGGEVIEKIERAKADFFGRPVLGQIVSMHEFRKFIEMLKLLPEEIRKSVFENLVSNLPEALQMLERNFSGKE